MRKTRATDLDIFAHSMGTFLTMEGLVDAQQDGRLGTRKTIDHIMLASPDIDIDLFRTQLAQLPKPVIEKIYLLVSADDARAALFAPDRRRACRAWGPPTRPNWNGWG